MCFASFMLLREVYLAAYTCYLLSYVPIGFSDPYCMLGIQPASLPASPRASEDEGRKHGFRLSFKRRDGRQQRDSLGRLPARYIRATSVRPHTLSPKWNETFKL